MSEYSTVFVGLDLHKVSIAVGYEASASRAEPTYLAPIEIRQCDIGGLVRKPKSKSQALQFVYEARPCGYWLYRYLKRKGLDCRVVAPSLIPRAAIWRAERWGRRSSMSGGRRRSAFCPLGGGKTNTRERARNG